MSSAICHTAADISATSWPSFFQSFYRSLRPHCDYLAQKYPDLWQDIENISSDDEILQERASLQLYMLFWMLWHDSPKERAMLDSQMFLPMVSYVQDLVYPEGIDPDEFNPISSLKDYFHWVMAREQARDTDPVLARYFQNLINEILIDFPLARRAQWHMRDTDLLILGVGGDSQWQARVYKAYLRPRDPYALAHYQWDSQTQTGLIAIGPWCAQSVGGDGLSDLEIRAILTHEMIHVADCGLHERGQRADESLVLCETATDTLAHLLSKVESDQGYSKYREAMIGLKDYYQIKEEDWRLILWQLVGDSPDVFETLAMFIRASIKALRHGFSLLPSVPDQTNWHSWWASIAQEPAFSEAIS